MNYSTRAGYVVILGRPNVGKSTLLNHLIGKKVSITARKAQTTRNQILGIKTVDDAQVIYVDTPGVGGKAELGKLATYMNNVVANILKDADVIVLVVAGTAWKVEDTQALKIISRAKVPVILAVNKLDLVNKNKSPAELNDYFKTLTDKHPFVEILGVSAKYNLKIAELEKKIISLLPQGPFLFEKDRVTDRDHKFLASEIIREKLTRLLGQELPYALSVLVTSFEMRKKTVFIDATIYVERLGQKKIVIGKGGETLKQIGTLSRGELEKLLLQKVCLKLWVKVKTNWTKDSELLRFLGYG